MLSPTLWTSQQNISWALNITPLISQDILALTVEQETYCNLPVSLIFWNAYNFSKFRDCRIKKISSYSTEDVGRDSIVGIGTCYRQDGLGIESRWGREFLHLCRATLGPIWPPIQWVPDIIYLLLHVLSWDDMFSFTRLMMHIQHPWKANPQHTHPNHIISAAVTLL
jgi:hypothetical protein